MFLPFDDIEIKFQLSACQKKYLLVEQDQLYQQGISYVIQLIYY